MEKKEKTIVWSNYDEQFSDYKQEWIDAYEDYLLNTTDLSEEEIQPMLLEEDKLFDFFINTNNDYLEGERYNLSSLKYERILIIGKLGLWDGLHNGYKVEYNKTLDKMLYDSDCDLCKWYVDNSNEFKFEGSHHDGDNEYTYRKVKEETTEDELSTLCSLIYKGEDYSELLDKLTTKIGPDILNVYGIR
jgi:hypothetical protein